MIPSQVSMVQPCQVIDCPLRPLSHLRQHCSCIQHMYGLTTAYTTQSCSQQIGRPQTAQIVTCSSRKLRVETCCYISEARLHMSPLEISSSSYMCCCLSSCREDEQHILLHDSPQLVTCATPLAVGTHRPTCISCVRPLC